LLWDAKNNDFLKKEIIYEKIEEMKLNTKRRRKQMIRIDPVTKLEFEPQSENHFFINREQFEEFIDQMDEIKDFNESIRTTKWEPIERICRGSGKKFIAMHPAQFYSEVYRKKMKDNVQPKEKLCMECGAPYFVTAPAMKYCDNCRPRDSKLSNKVE
jgi:ferredoxin-like protein FixX